MRNIVISQRQFEVLITEQRSKAIDKGLARLGIGTTKTVGRGEQILQQLEKEFDLKPRFNLQRTTTKVPRTWDYEKVKISDNLEFIGNPKGSKGLKATIMSVENPKTHEYVQLKKDKDDLGEYYFMSAKMSNPIDAGRAFNELIKRLPKGARFGEPIMGSLSTDSFYNILRRVSSFEPKVVGYVKLNQFGTKRFQEFIKNGIPPRDFNGGLLFKTSEDAKQIQTALDKEIKKVGLNSLTKLEKDVDTGMFNVMLPNIQLIVK